MDWVPELETGVQVVDDQHKEIIRRVNALLEACHNENVSIEIEKMLDFLADYVMIHFAAEEALMIESSYSEYSAHKKQHDGFTQSFIAMRTEYAKIGISLDMIRLINDVVVDWLMGHILRSDVVFAGYYKT